MCVCGELLCVHMQLFHMTEEKFREVEHEYDDDSDFTKEVSTGLFFRPYILAGQVCLVVS